MAYPLYSFKGKVTLLHTEEKMHKRKNVKVLLLLVLIVVMSKLFTL